MRAKRLTKKLIKVFSIILASLVVLLTAFHFWFVSHAKILLQNLVASKSKGTLKMEARNFKFNWFSRKMQLEDAVFYTTDTITAPTSYRFAVKKVKFKVRTILPMIFERRILINLIHLEDPDIVVTKIHSVKKDSLKKDEDLSIPREMGEIYKSIQDALQVLKVKKFEIENAKFTLKNLLKPEETPLVISHIDFHIDNFKVDDDRLTGREKIFFSDNIVLKCRDQDIIFPDGRHRLSFRKFRINIEKKIVEFDSCTIAALKTDSSSAGFSIFFNALQMTNIDFDTLYRSEVIKADSVYCVNPQFRLEVDLDQRKNDGKAAPKLDKIIRQLTGDMYLNYVVVQNAGFDITTLRKGKPSSFTSNGNNFEIQGLQIDNDAKRPLRVEKFTMAIRNYENFLRDSAYVMKFDSIIVNNNQIVLSRFYFQHNQGGRIIKSFSVPRFQLTGLSWDDLLFENKLTAQHAVLFNPVIHFTQAGKSKTQRNFYEVLSSINEVMTLEDLDIVRGNIDLKFSDDVEMKLENATVSVQSRSLLGSEQLSGIRRSVTHLDFTKGFFRINDYTVLLNGIKYTGSDSRMHATNALVYNQSGTVDATINDVFLDDIYINEANGDVTISGIFWEKADIKLGGLSAGKTSKKGSVLYLENIIGNDTRIHSVGKNKVSAFLKNITASELLKKPGQNVIIRGLAFNGDNFSLKNATSDIDIATFEISDQEKGVMENIRYKKITEADTTDISIPRLVLRPDIGSLINNNIIANDITLSNPKIDLHLGKKEKADGSLALPLVRSNRVTLLQPEIHFSTKNENGIVKFDWAGNKKQNNSIVLSNVVTDSSSLSIDQADISLNNFIYTGAKGKTFNARQGEITMLLNAMRLQRSGKEPIEWKATVTSLKGNDFFLDSLGKKSGNLDIKNIRLSDLVVSSATPLRQIIKDNQQFRLNDITGTYQDSMKSFAWHNAAYDKRSRIFTLDSFSYAPTPPKESYIAMFPYQVDYIRAKTGMISIGPFDLDRYLEDSLIKIGTIKISDIDFSDFRDNRPVFRSGIIKPTLTNRIKTIPLKLSIDSVLILNSNAVYSELNPKNNKVGSFPITRITARFFPVRNVDLTEKDTMRMQANGYLMDSIWMRLRLRESYSDPLSGFQMTLRIKPADMRVLNPVLIPLASFKIKSGWLDTLSMRVVGQDYLAFGEMNMRFHDLKVQLVNDDTLRKRGFIIALKTFFAGLIIRNKNTKKTGSVFFVRNRDRSSLNYLIKIAMSGVTSSIGVKSNKKLIRQYKKELEKRNLPPIDYD